MTGPHGAMARDPMFAHRAIRAAAQAFEVCEGMILGDNRNKDAVRARWAVMTAMRARGATLCQIARRVGRDHKTVMHGLHRARLIAAHDCEFAEALELVEAA